MEQSEKRLKVFEDKTTQTVVFIDAETNRVLSENEILGLHMKPAITALFAINKSAAFLGILERTSKQFRDFIREQGLWYTLLLRDFPEQCKDATEQASLNLKTAERRIPMMRPRVKDKLDRYSNKPVREYTYWKRYYELLSAPNDTLEWYLEDFNSTRILRYLRDERYNEQWQNPEGILPYKALGYRLFHGADRSRDVVYVTWHTFSRPGQLVDNEVDHSVKILEVNPFAKQAQFVEYDKKLLGPEILITIVENPLFDPEVDWRDFRGFRRVWFYPVDAYFTTMALAETKQLVSAQSNNSFYQ